MIYHHTKFGGKIIISLENTIWNSHILIIYKPRDLDREDSKQFFFLKLTVCWHMVMDHHTKFGYKRLSGSGDRQVDMVIAVSPS